MRQATKDAMRELLLSAGQELVSKKVIGKRNQIIQKKGIHDAATWVDKYSENFLLRNLRRNAKIFPYVIISEERKRPIVLGEEGEMLIDPLEGTDNYRYRRHPYGINMGIVENKQLVYSLFCDVSETPMQIVEAEKSNGAFLYLGEFKGGQKIDVNPANMHIAFNQWEDVKEDVIGKNYSELLKFTRRVSTTYSDSGDLCNVATGKYGGVVFIYKEAAPWDMVIALAAEEAGASVTDIFGNRWDSYDSRGLLVVKNGMIAAEKRMYEKLAELNFIL